MKNFLYSMLPSFVKESKYGDKIAHVIYGLLFLSIVIYFYR